METKDQLIEALQESIELLREENSRIREERRRLRGINSMLRRQVIVLLETAQANDEEFVASTLNAEVISDGGDGLSDAIETVEPTV